MAKNQLSKVIQRLRRVVVQSGGGLTDGRLLDSFVRQKDDAALAALVKRHGPMVWGVCQRILRNHHDAEDAFQATFLVLVRKAATIQRKELVANWLYGVARQTARRARSAAFKQGVRERQVTEMPEREALQSKLQDDLEPLLDQELSRLPQKYRVLIILCDLEGKTRKEVAQQLGRPEGTVAGQLARARAMLAKRLSRRGLAVSASTLGAALSAQAGSASAPAIVISSTIQAATLFAAGQTTAQNMTSAKVIALTDGVLKAMLLTKLKIVTALVFMAVALGGLGVSVGSPYLAITEEQAGQDQGKEKAKPQAIRTEQPKGKADTKIAMTSAESLRTTYLGNEALAEENLTGKTMRVTGMMNRIKRTGDQQRHAAFARQFPDRKKETTWSYDMISLQSAGDTPGLQSALPVIFEFGPETTPQLADLSLPLWPTIEGKCQGLVRTFEQSTLGPKRTAAIRFKDCKIVSVNNPKPHQIQSSSITATELARVFRDNDASIDEVWAVKKLQITGTMMRVTRNEFRLGGEKENAESFFLLVLDSRSPTSGELLLEPIYFVFKDDSRKELAGLKPGQRLTIEAQDVDGSNLRSVEPRAIVFKNCRILSVENP